MHWGENLLLMWKDQCEHTMTIALKSIVRCDMLGLEENFKGNCFGHTFFKGCQYATIEEKNCRNLQYVSIKASQGDL